jgi:SH3-like domain-containing protein
MQANVVLFATRLLLAFAIATGAGRARAAVTNGPDPTEPRPHKPAGKAERADTHGAKHPGKTEAHSGSEPGGKASAAKPDPKAHTAAPPPVPPAPAPAPAEAETKLPPFAALKFDDTNLRRGPGQRYPIDWVYKRRDLPLEIEGAYDVWRHVRGPDGVMGWVLTVQLTDRRTFMVKDADAMLRSDANDTASPVALLKPGVIGRLRGCEKGSSWCQVQVSGYKGYLRRNQLWGVLPDEDFNAS